MSNTQVGAIYQQIIADVIESSRVDFEEGGVDDNVLEALRKGWQTKLTQLDVAVFPWDPKPDPIVSVPNAPPSVSSNGGGYQHINNQVIPQQHLQQVSNNTPRIKTEPGTENSSIHQYETSRSQIDLGNAQTDGSNDGSNNRFNTMSSIKRSYAPKDKTTPICRSQIDNLIRLKVEAMGTLVEGGGLMVPLRQCVMKDGVLTVNNKEYVFHKASGEVVKGNKSLLSTELISPQYVDKFGEVSKL
ncbi:putative transcription factor iia [Erysiphe neolycopersici]|uniref:Transcription initiation factor IIA large subunit n=1 Tax=Erysiphe neolycopersici TaxID=212602 RepID=A0A420HXQ3_9PEZI|nr:putative transcription factor iia [Erysiphe neolycopersici]